MISFDFQWGPPIARSAGTFFNPDCDIVVARTRMHKGQERLMGGSVFQNYTGESIGIHVASLEPNWISRQLLFATFGYPFLQLGVERIFGQVPANLPEVLAFDLHLGFREIARIPKVFRGGVDDIVVCMERHECRFLRMPKSNSESEHLH